MTVYTTQSAISRPLAAAALLWICAASLAQAQAQPSSDDATRAVARQLGTEGIEAYQANDLATADQKLERAYRLFAAPTLGLWSARTRVKLGRWVEGAERYREATRMPAELSNSAPQRAAQADATKELDALVSRIPTLTLTLEHAEPSEVEISLDGEPYARDLIGVARPTNPGEHKLLAARGSERVELVLQLVAQQHSAIPLVFQARAPAAPVAVVAAQPSPAEPPPTAAAPAPPPVQAEIAAPVASESHASQGTAWTTPVGIVALSVGAAGLATWGVTALIANGQLEDCPVKHGEHMCTTEDQASSYNTTKTISTVSFWTGAVLAVGGVSVLLLGSSGDEHDTESVRWSVGPTGVALSGAF